MEQEGLYGKQVDSSYQVNVCRICICYQLCIDRMMRTRADAFGSLCIIAFDPAEEYTVADSQGIGHATLSESAKSEVREQLSRLLSNPFFSHSKRFPTFLRFVVEQTLAGEADNIKERTLGIEIFGRDADYDTASDPIVRVTAAEIRKRVAQYYQDPAHVNELRIALPSGSYIPQFHWPKGANDPVLSELAVAAAEDVAPAEILHPLHPSASPPTLPTRPLAYLHCRRGAVGGAVLLWQTTHRSALDFFWGPVLATKDPVLLCIADQLQYSSIVLRDACRAGPSGHLERQSDGNRHRRL